MTRPDEVRMMARSVKQYVRDLAAYGVKELPMGTVKEHRSTRGVTSPRRSRASELETIEREVKACQGCSLYRTRTHHVFGEGDPHAKLVFVGEAPGRDEDLQGRPFIGAAGRLLTKMIEAIGLRREGVYICNVLKDRPPGNRTPAPEEIEACRPFLARQLAIIRPTVICTLGAVATKALLGPHVAITKIRGQQQSYDPGITPTGDGQTGPITLIPTFHPAYLLRNPDAKRFVWQDLKRVKRLIDAGNA